MQQRILNIHARYCTQIVPLATTEPDKITSGTNRHSRNPSICLNPPQRASGNAFASFLRVPVLLMAPRTLLYTKWYSMALVSYSVKGTATADDSPRNSAHTRLEGVSTQEDYRLAEEQSRSWNKRCVDCESAHQSQVDQKYSNAVA